MADETKTEELAAHGKKFKRVVEDALSDGGRVLTLTDENVVVIPLPMFEALRGRKREDATKSSDFSDWNQNSDGIFPGDSSDIAKGAD